MNRCKKCGDEFMMQSFSNPIYCFQCSLIVLPEFEQQIAQLTKERDQLKQQNQDLILTYKAQQFLEREIDDLRTHLDAKTGQCFELEAKCAAMRQRLEEILEVSELIDDETGHQTKATEKVLSDQCGEGWFKKCPKCGHENH